MSKIDQTHKVSNYIIKNPPKNMSEIKGEEFKEIPKKKDKKQKDSKVKKAKDKKEKESKTEKEVPAYEVTIKND